MKEGIKGYRKILIFCVALAAAMLVPLYMAEIVLIAFYSFLGTITVAFFGVNWLKDKNGRYEHYESYEHHDRFIGQEG